MECIKCNYKNDDNFRSCVKCGTSLTLDPMAFSSSSKNDEETKTKKPAKRIGNSTFRLGLAITILCLLYFFVALALVGMYSAVLDKAPDNILKYISLADKIAMIGIVLGLVISGLGIWQMAKPKSVSQGLSADEEARLMALMKDQLPPDAQTKK